jgi:hypothetical protein
MEQNVGYGHTTGKAPDPVVLTFSLFQRVSESVIDNRIKKSTSSPNSASAFGLKVDKMIY